MRSIQRCLGRAQTNLYLNKFKLEEVCAGGECERSGEELGVWLHLKADKTHI